MIIPELQLDSIKYRSNQILRFPNGKDHMVGHHIDYILYWSIKVTVSRGVRFSHGSADPIRWEFQKRMGTKQC